MKKALLLTILLTLLIAKPVKADVVTDQVWATAYCISGTTATGTQTKQGRTVASKREWFGCVMCVWEDDGTGQIKPENFIGTFTVEDTGGRTIQNGSVIDIFFDDYETCRQFGSKKVIIQVIESVG